MTRILVTGSADGLGRLAAESLLSAGHDVVVHARTPARAADLRALVDRGADLVVGDFTDRDACDASPNRLLHALAGEPGVSLDGMPYSSWRPPPAPSRSSVETERGRPELGRALAVAHRTPP